MPESGDDESQLSDSERARERRRDRKRETRMVVDNAGIRRVLPALQRRQGRGTSRVKPPDARPDPPP